MTEIEILVPEFEYRRKGPVWYLVAVVVAAIMGFLAWLVKNYTFIGLIVFSLLILIMRQVKKPNLVSLKIDANGISIGRKTWEYKDLRGFAIFEAEDKKYLIIMPAGKFGVNMKVQVSDAEAIVNKLINYLAQVEYEESLTESLARILRL